MQQNNKRNRISTCDCHTCSCKTTTEPAVQVGRMEPEIQAELDKILTDVDDIQGRPEFIAQMPAVRTVACLILWGLAGLCSIAGVMAVFASLR